MSGEVIQLPIAPGTSLVTKRQLAAMLGRSTRWVELRMREGLPVEPRRSSQESARFDIRAVEAWLEARAGDPSLSLLDRVARLEQELARLAATLRKEQP
jgi:phage terminase Nu1 subunit (DNA packaging protein)